MHRLQHLDFQARRIGAEISPIYFMCCSMTALSPRLEPVWVFTSTSGGSAGRLREGLREPHRARAHLRILGADQKECSLWERDWRGEGLLKPVDMSSPWFWEREIS